MVDETGLSRWSRLKRAKTKEATETPAAPVAAEAPMAVPAVNGEEVEGGGEGESPAPVAVEDLPDPDSLDKDSDFSVFLGENVPAELRRRALKVLWRSDPVLANLDGLNDYDEDFSILQTVGEVVKTAYQVGKGYADEVEEIEEAVAQVDDDGADGAAGEEEKPADDIQETAEAAPDDDGDLSA